MTERDEKEEERVNACILLHECAHDELVVSRRGVIINVVGLYVACPESAVTNGLSSCQTKRPEKQFAPRTEIFNEAEKRVARTTNGGAPR